MAYAIHSPNKPHPSIAACFNNLGFLYEAMRKWNKALEALEKSLYMYKIHGPDEPQPNIAASLINVRIFYKALRKLEKALENQYESLEMRLAIREW